MEGCHDLLQKMVEHLEMTALMPPYLIKANSNEEQGGKDPGGITGFVCIAESHISIHTFVLRKFVSMDVYSCKPFDYDKAVAVVKDHFNPEEIEIHTLDRGTKYPARNIA
jgi:S-adenosylmethionine decarboxylase